MIEQVRTGRALQLKPDNADTYLFAGNLLLKAGKSEEALRMYQQYLHLAPRGHYTGEARKLVAGIRRVMPAKKEPDLHGLV